MPFDDSAQRVGGFLEDQISLIGYLSRLIVGVSVFVTLIYFAVGAISHFWRGVAQNYAGQPFSRRTAHKFPESIVMTGRTDGRAVERLSKGWHTFAPVQINVHQDGLALAMMPPFNLRCRPLFLPFAEMEMTETWWALWPQPVAIRMKRAPAFDIIVSRETARWIRDEVTHQRDTAETD